MRVKTQIAAFKVVSFLILVPCVVQGTRTVMDFQSTVEAIFKKVKSLQVKEDVPFRKPLFWEKHKGMYESDVKEYFHGKEDLYLFRKMFRVYDDNMFATAWITSCLLETFRYGNGPKPSEDQIMSAILSIREYHNKNVDFANSLMTFWPQKYNNTYRAWQSYPRNLRHLLDFAATVNGTELDKILDKLGLHDIAEIMDHLLSMNDGLKHVFMIPPDFDDTFVNLGLGALLAEVKQDFPESHAQWKSQNTNLTSIYDALKKYAYRPMSKRDAVNSIDCRTYFYLRFFLEKAEENKEDIALVPTWIQDTEEVKTWSPRGVDMPFDINNIDVTVAANGVFGITSAILNGLVDVEVLDDPEINQIYLNTSSLIAFMIQTNFSSRHDLALLYYPSAFEFYWFVARTFGELQRRSKIGPLPHPALESVRKVLDTVLHNHMTNAVLNATKKDLSDDTVYYDDFMGDGDFDKLNNTKIRGEDRLFTTSMAINALLSTWTVFDDGTKKLIWETGTPEKVKVTVTKAANFVNKYILGRNYQHWNAFFSGSIKGPSTGPYYPAIGLINATISDNKGDYNFGFRGVVTEKKYKSLLKQKWKGHTTPLDFHGYNNYPNYWPFWCSESYTYVTAMLALARFSNTGNSAKVAEIKVN